MSLVLQSGNVTSLIGPNGAGKTTLFNLIAGQIKPSSGDIVFDRRRLNRRGPDEIARLGILRSFQNTMVLPGLTVQEHLSQAALLPVIGRPIDLLRRGRINRAKFDSVERVDAVLELTGLTAQRDVAAEALPYGLQKILGIGMAMAAQPRLLLADEPAAGLNGAEMERMERLLRAVHARGVTIVLVEHDLRLVMRLSERVIVLAQGEIIADGRPDEVRNNPHFVEVYLGAPDSAS
ncbi:ABC transporter ATP-binding protein [Tardiphaga robiniae]|uniref:ABC transporter ATP-binding protein n=1 Tax=Tardiphaga robiniae TaxID=943830 RepID=A0A7G6TXG3_9BRAD|nr:ABC transporter ATP-binding protein [Tardiphaga robiniae]QND71445.1 ABC transporter ATP-binding protein [Tardiphaga robiniae]